MKRGDGKPDKENRIEKGHRASYWASLSYGKGSRIGGRSRDGHSEKETGRYIYGWL